jgi:phosphopantothenoylcysteine decarboxylase/phosphopantothenate--cysteine ligase
MGYAIAEELADEGANVILVSGPVNVSTKKKNINVILVESAEEMYTESLANFSSCNGAVMCAAVADFTPISSETQKTKRGNKNWLLELKPTKDISAALGKLKTDNQILTGFALETNDEIKNAKQKLKNKNLDFIVLNSLNEPGAGFKTDTNKVTIIDSNDSIQIYGLKSKKEVAKDIVEKIITLTI